MHKFIALAATKAVHKQGELMDGLNDSSFIRRLSRCPLRKAMRFRERKRIGKD